MSLDVELGRESVRKPTPPIERLAEDVWSVPLPNPGSPSFTYCYLLTSPGGVVVVDPGWASDSGWPSLLQALEGAGFAPSDVVGVAITHAHRDHHGLSGRLRAETGAWIGMHPREAQAIGQPVFASVVALERQWLHRAGVPDDEVEELLPDPGEYADRERLARPDVLLDDGELLSFDRPIRAIWTPGHTAGHLCFYDERNRLMLTGDHVLPRISPHVSQRPGEASDVASYLSSLHRLDAFDVEQALPAHEYRIPDLRKRTAEIADHRRLRDLEVLDVLAMGDASVWEIAPRLSWSRGWVATRGLHRRSALAETSAHLIHLLGVGAISRFADRGAPAVVRWHVGDGQITSNERGPTDG